MASKINTNVNTTSIEKQHQRKSSLPPSRTTSTSSSHSTLPPSTLESKSTKTEENSSDHCPRPNLAHSSGDGRCCSSSAASSSHHTSPITTARDTSSAAHHHHLSSDSSTTSSSNVSSRRHSSLSSPFAPLLDLDLGGLKIANTEQTATPTTTVAVSSNTQLLLGMNEAVLADSTSIPQPFIPGLQLQTATTTMERTGNSNDDDDMDLVQSSVSHRRSRILTERDSSQSSISSQYQHQQEQQHHQTTQQLQQQQQQQVMRSGKTVTGGVEGNIEGSSGGSACVQQSLVNPRSLTSSNWRTSAIGAAAGTHPTTTTSNDEDSSAVLPQQQRHHHQSLRDVSSMYGGTSPYDSPVVGGRQQHPRYQNQNQYPQYLPTPHQATQQQQQQQHGAMIVCPANMSLSSPSSGAGASGHASPPHIVAGDRHHVHAHQTQLQHSSTGHTNVLAYPSPAYPATATMTNSFLSSSSSSSIAENSNDNNAQLTLDSSYAYCYDRGNGQYTRLVPADMLPPLRDIAPLQQGCSGMIVLRQPRSIPPNGQSSNTEPVILRSPPTMPESLKDAIQSRIDTIIASTPPIPPHIQHHSHRNHQHQQQQHHHHHQTPSNSSTTDRSAPGGGGGPSRRPKIYCDKWVHEGVCAFTQQGCKYKHEMPFDKVTQHQLGLFHGYPAWWKKHQADLNRQRDAPVATGPTPAPIVEEGRESEEARFGRKSGSVTPSIAGSNGGDSGAVSGELGGGRGSSDSTSSAQLTWRRSGEYGSSGAGNGEQQPHLGSSSASATQSPSLRSVPNPLNRMASALRNPIVSYGSRFGPIAPPARSSSSVTAAMTASVTMPTMTSSSSSSSSSSKTITTPCASDVNANANPPQSSSSSYQQDNPGMATRMGSGTSLLSSASPVDEQRTARHFCESQHSKY